eukprot:394107-Rhodomonas_salina.1
MINKSPHWHWHCDHAPDLQFLGISCSTRRPCMSGRGRRPQASGGLAASESLSGCKPPRSTASDSDSDPPPPPSASARASPSVSASRAPRLA